MKFLGGKPDALIAGSNVEISNKLTLQRRPGLIPYGVSNVPEPTNFFDWELATTSDIILVVDTETPGGDNSAGLNGAVFNYSPTHSGIYFNKANLAKQSNFISVANTMYVGDGVDLLKVIGPNLLKYSNTFGSGSGTLFSIQSPWIEANVFALSSGVADPVGGTSAVQLVWGTTGATAYLEQDVVPNYTPIPNNTFTFSIWIREIGTPLSSVDLQIRDQSGVIATTTVSLNQGWVKYQVTGTMNSGSSTVNVRLTNPTTTNPIAIYGAQLEVGGPATTTQITTNLPQGVYLWGIQAPGTAPNISVSSSVVGTPWQPNHAYTTAILALTSVANASAGSTVYTGKIVNGAGNFFAGYKFTVAGFFNAPNNGVYACTASSGTTLTLTNPNGVLETNPGTATPNFSITSVVAGNRSATYFGTILGGVAIGYAGYALTIQGFSNPGNNGTFFCTASNNTSITLLNINAVNETANTSALLLGQAVTDSNGNLEVATSSGTSGSTAPPWSAGIGGQTPDGLQNIFIVQTADNASTGASSAVTLPNNVTLGNSLLAFMVVNRNASAPSIATDSKSNTYTPIAGITSGPFSIYLSWAQNVAAGMTTITATCSGAGDVWIGVVESSPLNNLDVEASNQANSIPSGSGVFQTGLVSTAQIDDLLISFSCVIAGNQSTSSSSPPPSFIEMLNATGVELSQGKGTINVAFEFLTTTETINPQWTVTFGAGGSRELGITAAFNAASTTTLVWTNYGAIALTAIIGFTYYYAFMNSETGHVSNVSPLSGSTGPIGGQSVTITGIGMQTTPSGPYGQDPQVDTIALFRNTDGGGFWYQVATFPNPGTAAGAGTWSYVDVTPSSGLNTSISAPIGLLNSLPPAGLVNMEYFEGRLFGSVNNLLYYNTAADNATILGVTQNGVAAESWIGDNVIPFNAAIVRSVAVGGGLIVCTTLDTWFVTGQNILQGGFNPGKALAKHGVRFYNSLDLDGSNVYMYTSDRECLVINPNSGSVELGFPIGDLLEKTFSPLDAFVVRHVAGSRDNAVFLADSDGWYRLNPNQVGASMAGEATPVWSPKADFTQSIDGIGAIASIETSPGNIQLLVGQKGNNAGAVSAPVGIQNTIVQLSASQIKNAFATPITLIPASSCPNRAIVPLSCTIQLNFVTTAYTTDPNPTIGFGSSAADVVANGWMMFPTGGLNTPFMKLAATSMDFTSVTAGGQAAGAFDPSSHIVNQPLLWANETDISGNAGDSTVTMNIQWIEVDTTNGKIVNGAGNNIHGSLTTLTAADLTSSTPVTLVPAQGANKVAIPVSMILWTHADSSDNDLVQMQPPLDAFWINNSGVRPTPPPSKVVNQPLSFGFQMGFPRNTNIGYGSNLTDIFNAGVFQVFAQVQNGDSINSVSVYIQYAVINTVTGALTSAGSNGGDLAHSYTSMSASQIKNASTIPISLASAPGANRAIFPVSFIAKSQFVHTPFPDTSGNFPLPSVGNGTDAAFLDFQYFMAPNFLPNASALFTASHNQIVLGTPQAVQAVGDCTTAETFNAPIQWADTYDLSGSAADSTGTAMIQYVTVDLTTGNILSQESAVSSCSVVSGSPILVRDLDVFTDSGVPYDWTATIGSILLTTPGKLAEVDSITTEMNAAEGASQCTVAVLLDEIAGVPESLPMAVNDPPGEIPSVSVLSNRFYLSQGDDCPVCRHIQIQLTGEDVSGLPQSSKDEILALTVRGALVSEQS